MRHHERTPIPVDEQRETPEERALVEASRAEYARSGRGFSQQEVEALIAKRRA